MLRDIRARWQRCVLASGLPDGAKVTPCALRDFLDRTGTAWPSYGTLAALSGQSRRAVIGHVREAESAGFLLVERRPRERNVYRVAVKTDDVRRGDYYAGMVNGPSLAMVNEDSPTMVNVGAGGGERQRHLVVNGGAPKIHKRNTQREIHTPCAPITDAQFAEFKAAYPRRSGDQQWQRARKAIDGHLRRGYAWAEILASARRYAAYAEATDRLGTQYVKQAGTFCGPEKHFLESWDPPESQAQRQQDRNIVAAQNWLRQEEQRNAAA